MEVEDRLALLLGNVPHAPDNGREERKPYRGGPVLRSSDVSWVCPKPVPMSELAPGCGDVNWLWDGFLAGGFMSLLSSAPKCGKSTLIGHLLGQMGPDGGALGTEVRPARVLVVSEESQLLWKRRRDALEIGDNAWIMSRPFRGRADWLQWSLFADALAAMVREMSLDLIIIDTIGSVWPVEVENDASPVVEALSQLEAITAAGAALLCTHHLRKSGGTEGMAARGSGAILGVPDVLMELRRYQPGSRSDRRRVLTRYSRLDETDEDNELVLELGDNGYTCCGSRTDVRMDDRVGRIMDILAGSDDGMTIVAIQEAWGGDDETEPVSKRTIQAAMNNLITDDRVERTGVRGSKKNPYRYSKKEEGAAQRSAAGTFL